MPTSGGRSEQELEAGAPHLPGTSVPKSAFWRVSATWLVTGREREGHTQRDGNPRGGEGRGGKEDQGPGMDLGQQGWPFGVTQVAGWEVWVLRVEMKGGKGPPTCLPRAR